MELHPFSAEQTFFVATKCVFLCDWKALVVSERLGDSTRRELPGGKISQKDRDFSPVESLLRELQEELGVSDFSQEKFELFAVHKAFEHHSVTGHDLPMMFLCYRYYLNTQFIPMLSSEHADFQWIDSEQIGGFSDWRPGFDSIVRKALA